MNINNLCRVATADAVAAGWHGEPTQDMVTRALLLIHSEVSEACEAYRKDLADSHMPHRPGIEVELADAVIRICDLAGTMGLDLEGAILDKMEYNRNRADHKAEARAQKNGKRF